MANKTVLVTGAGGCVGYNIVKEALAHGCEVTATDLPGAPYLKEHPGVKVVAGDLAKNGFIEQLPRADVVIHAAEKGDTTAPWSKLEALNVTAFKRLFKQAKVWGAERFLYLSTACLFVADGGEKDEQDRIEPANDYERTKATCEYYLISYPDNGPPSTILRLAPIYGPGVTKGTTVAACLPPVLKETLGFVPNLKGGPASNWLHVEDAGRAAVEAALNPKAAGDYFLAAGDDRFSMGDALGAAARTYGIEAGPPLPYPALFLKLARPGLSRQAVLENLGRAFDYAWRRVVDNNKLKNVMKPRLDQEILAQAAHGAVFKNEKLKSLGFELKHKNFEESWAETIRGGQQEELLPSY